MSIETVPAAIPLKGCEEAWPSYALRPSTGTLSGPGLFSIFTQFYEFKESCSVLFRGSKDREALLDAVIRVCSNLPGIVYSALSLTKISLAIMSVAKLAKVGVHIRVISKWLGPLGIIATTFDTMFTSLKLKRTYQFLDGFCGGLYENLSSDLKSIERISKKYETLLEESPEVKKSLAVLKEEGFSRKALEDLEKSCIMTDILYLRNNYLPIPEEEIMDPAKRVLFAEQSDATKASRLSNRVQPWCQERVFNELPTILKNLRSGNPESQSRAAEEAKILLETVKKQANKAKVIHILSLTVLAVTIVGFVAFLAAFPYSIPIILLVIGTVSALGVEVFSGSTLSCEGDEYKLSDSIPDWIKRYILMIDLEKDERNVDQVLSLLKDNNIKAAEAKASEIEDKYLRAKAYYSVACISEDQEMRDVVLGKIKKLSLFYFHRAEESSKL
jgi:hypothetical protein